MMQKKIEFIVEFDSTVRDYLKEKLSKKLYKSLRNNGQIFLNEKEALRHELIKKGDTLVIYYLIKENDNWPIFDELPKIIYECENYLVVYKRAGLLTIPTKSEPRSLYQSIQYYFKVNNICSTISFINRLDKETQGLVLVAKNRITANHFNSNKNMISRRYLALCNGHFSKKEDKIITYIDKDEHKRFVNDKGKLAITNYKVIEENDNNTLVMFSLETGRTHQIRVHSSYLGNPIIGDDLYGNKEAGLMCLCSYYIEFIDPQTQKKMKFEIKPEWM